MLGSMHTPLWKSERLGLIMIGVSFAVIALVIVVTFQYQQDSRETQAHHYGTTLTRLISNIPLEQLTTPSGNNVFLEAMRSNQDSPDFAYAVVTDSQGNVFNEFKATRIIIPDVELPSEPSSWLAKRTLSHAADGRNIQEYHAPLLVDGNLAGFVRLGFFEPGVILNMQQLLLFATLSLPIFLLTAFFHFLIKRQAKPLNHIGRALEKLIEGGFFERTEIESFRETGNCSERFNNFIELAGNRITTLKSQHTDLVTSAKFLSYKRERMEMALQSIPEGVLVLDETSVITYANAKLLPLLGMDPEEVIGGKLEEWCHNLEIKAFLSKYNNKAVASYSSESIEFSPDNAPGKTIAIKAYPLVSRKDNVTVLGILVVLADITHEKYSKEGRSEFVAHIAHELKTPLNVLAMYSEALQGEEGQKPEFRIEATNVIYDEVERLSALINNLLSLTKFEMGSMTVERQRIKPRDLLEDVMANVSRSGRGEDIDFKLDLPKELGAISADKDLLRIAVNNLLTNAIKYSRPGGTVTMSAEETENQLTIRVIDNGIGIQSEDQEKIFEKFYRSNDEEVRNRTGHGLGLPLAREIIQLHHGNLHVDSTLGEGSEFIIELRKEVMLIDKAS